MTSNKIEVLLMKVLLFISYYFSKKQIVFPFAIKYNKKHLLPVGTYLYIQQYIHKTD